MENTIEIKIINGYWTVNGKPLNRCSSVKKDFFAQYVKMQLLKSSLPGEVKRKNNPLDVKRCQNYSFKGKLKRIADDFLNNEPNIKRLIFEPKN